MDDHTHPLRARDNPLARAIGIAVASLLFLLGLGIPGAHAVERPASGSHTFTVKGSSLEDQTSPTAPNGSPREPKSSAEATDPTEPGELTEPGSDDGHRFLSPGLLGLAGLVAATALVGTFLMIRTRRRSRTNQETER
ncbi:hypothetical protein [Paeniglutamicibacter sp.]|uniref:hypothetical protein n=1 Tax=Paeniglutamicibacter sp. TaxID=1934391 RepID=UPI0039899641